MKDRKGETSQVRYERQVLLPELGPAGQRQLARGAVAIIGCGALGSMAAGALARAGTGRLRVVDRDTLELGNLHRQVLYDEEDVASGLPKAEAAARRLRAINSEIQVEGLVADVTSRNVLQLLEQMDLVVDGTDNFETRYLLNDACLRTGRPWIYGGVVGTSGMTLTIRPGRGPCLRCLFPLMPEPGSFPTCETRGVLGTMPMAIGALQATEAIKLLVGAEPCPGLRVLGLWGGSLQEVAVAQDPRCPACGRGELDYLGQAGPGG